MLVVVVLDPAIYFASAHVGHEQIDLLLIRSQFSAVSDIETNLSEPRFELGLVSGKHIRFIQERRFGLGGGIIDAMDK